MTELEGPPVRGLFFLQALFNLVACKLRPISRFPLIVVWIVGKFNHPLCNRGSIKGFCLLVTLMGLSLSDISIDRVFADRFGFLLVVGILDQALARISRQRQRIGER